MTDRYEVKAAACVVRAGGTERYLYRGAGLPAGVAVEELERLAADGLIGKVVVKEAATPPRAARSRKSASEPQEGAGDGSDE